MCQERNGRSVGKEFRNGKQNEKREEKRYRSETNCESGVEECKENLYMSETNGIGRVHEEI